MWYLLDLVIHVRAYPTFSKINCQYLWERLSYFVYLLLVVTHPGKLQCYHFVLEQYGPACPNFSEITNRQYLWRGWVILLTFCKYLLVSCWISIEGTKICYFGLELSSIGSQEIRSDVLNLKNLKTIWGIKLIVCFHWSYKKYHAILGYVAKCSWSIRLQDFLFLTCLTC